MRSTTANSAPTPGLGRIILDAGEAGQDFEFIFTNALPEMKFGTEAGIELGTYWMIAIPCSSAPVPGRVARVPPCVRKFRFRSLTPVGFERSARMSYFQYFLGWQRTLLSEAKKFKLHGRLAMHQVFDIDYKEDMVFGFDTGTETSSGSLSWSPRPPAI